MLKFVTDKTAAPYFSNLVWFIGNHILDIDACVRNDADHQSLNRLKDLVAEHLDHLHYINDILCLQIDSLNMVLSEHLLNRLFIPLYMYSLSRTTVQSAEDLKPFVSPVVALFLLCQVFLIIAHVPLVRLLAWIIVAGDKEVFTERGATLYVSSPKKKSRVKPSFIAPTESLDKSLENRIKVRFLVNIFMVFLLKSYIYTKHYNQIVNKTQFYKWRPCKDYFGPLVKLHMRS